MRGRLTVLVGALVSVALLVWALRGVSAAELLRHLGEANVWLLIAATVVATLTFNLRAIRWEILLRASNGSLPFGSRYAAVCIGFMANNVLPGRLGEFVRAYSLSRITPVPLSAALASLVVERLLDAIVLMVFLVPAFFIVGVDEAASGTLRDLFTLGVVLVSASLLALALLVRSPDRFLRLAARWSRRVAPDRVANRIMDVLSAFVDGLGALRHAHVFARAMLWSFAVWAWNAASFYLGFLAFGIVGPGFLGALVLQTTISFAVAIPSTPGFFGPFEAAARVALELHQIEPARIISFAAGYHILTFLPITVLGIWYMRRLGISRRELGRSEAPGPETSTPETSAPEASA
ncbi:MAG: lysylphosphatidylglycerol synthase transmembrane domain-containing protein [Gemmatimonadota bacterium]|uniref:lysylphosphatidylglycerol synthase transmembrane domain-containing protein n=1 Tax=Candidatus Palauibacter scopulicola TaxID=3056741 RepID=UPI002384E33A|nr:lysylphosphatidylglycerol synthase transmembrane domain-containing protein [Candidatus Palauibacter scopulicola]MDE2661614.1 lysylphosphatidylglycerol synthase transmembrane domain-containing protein [Candidatus Palauibacter scopulicola]